MQALLQQARGYLLLAKELKQAGIPYEHYVSQARQLLARYNRMNSETILLKVA